MSYLSAQDEASWLEAAERGADWWIAHVPEDRVAFWDFDDPAIPDTERDTAATAVASSGLGLPRRRRTRRRGRNTERRPRPQSRRSSLTT
jgi:hypothetical protein